MPDEQFPVFPPEIEEIIFSLCFFNDWKSAQNLILVAKRVHQWIIQRVYSVALFHSDPLTQCGPRYTTRSLTQFGKHVRHILIFNVCNPTQAGVFNEPEDCLTKCPNVTDVALWIYSPEIDQAKRILDQLLSLRHLTYLSIDLDPYAALLRSGTGAHLHEYTFSTVTHLELIRIWNWVNEAEPQWIDGLFPALTHLSLIIESSDRVSPITASILQNPRLNRRLEVFIWDLGCSGARTREPEVVPTSEYVADVDDMRVVVMWYGQKYPETWYDGVTGGMGIWRTAEDAIRGRRKALAS